MQYRFARVLATAAISCLVACGAAPKHTAAAPRRVGDAMEEVGMRFGRVGRAVLAGRWELAGYDLHELHEVFADDLGANPWMNNAKLPPLAHDFDTRDLPAIDTALRARDRDAFQRAIAQAAHACNECHKAAKMDYIEVSEIAGADVPVIAPTEAAVADRR